jgi:hypothetical protein
MYEKLFQDLQTKPKGMEGLCKQSAGFGQTLVKSPVKCQKKKQPLMAFK